MSDVSGYLRFQFRYQIFQWQIFQAICPLKFFFEISLCFFDNSSFLWIQIEKKIHCWTKIYTKLQYFIRSAVVWKGLHLFVCKISLLQITFRLLLKYCFTLSQFLLEMLTLRKPSIMCLNFSLTTGVPRASFWCPSWTAVSTDANQCN